MAVTDTGGVLTGTTEWAIYAALKQGGTLLSTDGLDDLANKIWMSMSNADCSKMVSVDLSVWINDSTKLVMIGPAGDLGINDSAKLVMIGPAGDLDMPAAATAEGVISVSATSYVTFGLSIELLGVSGERQDVHTYSSALIALNDALDDWGNNLISALEH